VQPGGSKMNFHGSWLKNCFIGTLDAIS